MGFFDKLRNKFSTYNPRNFSVMRKTDYDFYKDNYNAFSKAAAYGDYEESSYIDTNSRPSLSEYYLDTPTGSKIPLWRVNPIRVFEMAEQVGDYRAILQNIQREMFRNGAKVEPAFKYQCIKCGKHFTEKPVKQGETLGTSGIPLNQVGNTAKKEQVSYQCDDCGEEGEHNFKVPDPDQKVKLTTLLQHGGANKNEQSIIKVAKQFEWDLDIMDGAYTVVPKRYYVYKRKEPDPETGAIYEVDDSKTEVDEFVRVHPVQVAFIANDEGQIGMSSYGKVAWICPFYEHRTKLLDKPVCDCGTKAFTAVIETNSVPYGVPVNNPKKRYYARHEVIWDVGKYWPDLLYGNPPMIAIWKKVMSLYHQDEYIWKYFDKQRPPKSLLIMGSRNYESARSFWERQKQGARADPFMPRPILLNTENVNSALEYVDLTPNFKELQLTELRKELRQIISALHGVQPAFYGEQQKGSMGGESMQMTITNRTIKGYQKYFNEAFFDQVAQVMGVTDWRIVLNDVEEVDLLRHEQIRGQQIDNASKMYTMGFQVWTDGNGKIVTSQYPSPELQQMQNGMGSNVKQGKTDKVKDTNPKQEQSTNHEGEPLQNRPSDPGGEGEGSATAGFSYSKKSDDYVMEKAKEIIKKGALNTWTITNMAKKLDNETTIGREKALNLIQTIIEKSMEEDEEEED